MWLWVTNTLVFFFRNKKREPELRCSTCNIVFVSNNFLQRHYRIDHISCKVCKKVFSAAGLKNHLQEKPECTLIGLQESPCEICSSNLKNSERLNHYLNHKKCLDVFMCIFCFGSFKSYLKLVNHLQVKHKFTKYFHCQGCKGNLPEGQQPVECLNTFLHHLMNCWTKRLGFKSVNLQVANQSGTFNVLFLRSTMPIKSPSKF